MLAHHRPKHAPCRLLEMRRAYQAALAPEHLGLLGVFIDNHVS